MRKFDDYKRVTKVTVDGSTSKTYQFYYGANGQVAKLVDSILNRVVYSEYDVENRPMRITTTEGTSHVYTGQVWYDEYNNLKTFKEWVGTGKTQFRTDFTYDTENKPTKLTYGDDYNKVEYTYDGIGRSSDRSVRFGTSDSNRTYSTAYSYLAGSYNSSTTTALISGITQTGENFTYTYDDVGNIASVTQNSKTTYYIYDNLGQLIRVNDQNDPTSGTTGTTWTYEYDLGGNILNKKRYAYTTDNVGTVKETVTYTYGDSNWKDKLTQYSVQIGTNTPTTYTVASDEIGNPTNDGVWKYYWEKGRRLKGLSDLNSDDPTIVFKYNSEGLRVQKTVNGTVTNYTLHGKNIVHMTQGSSTLHFWYDASNRPAIVQFNGTRYAYIHDFQGDIVGIVDTSGNEVVKYTYDAWGKVLSTTGSLAATLGTVQPFRYRGYVYDVETGLYYLRARYYNPAWNRFVNADVVIDKNLYFYSFNNPIMLLDRNGKSPEEDVDYVGQLAIFAHPYHAWIAYTPNGGETTTYGTWGRDDHPKGIYEGREAYLIIKGEYSGRVSIEVSITAQEESNLFAFINTHDYWEYEFNCADFALEAWMAAGQKRIVIKNDTYLYPNDLVEGIKRQDQYDIDARIAFPKPYYESWDKYIAISQVE